MKKLICACAVCLLTVFAALPALAYSLSAEGELTVDRGDDPMFGLDRTAVTSVKVAEGVTYLGEGLLEGCSMAEEVTLPSTLTLVGRRALADCASLTYVRLPSGVTEVGSEAFDGCAFLKSVIIPRSVVLIADDAFDHAVKVYGYSGSYASTYANRRVYRLTSLGTEDIIKERFTFESVDGCDTDAIKVYRNGTPRVNFFRNNTAESPVTDVVSWLSQPDVYGIITIQCNNEFFWTDKEGVRFDTYFDARDAHRTNQYNFSADGLTISTAAGSAFDATSGFRNGLAIVSSGGRYGVADTSGRPVTELDFTGATVIGGEVFLVRDGLYYTRGLRTPPEGTWMDTDYCFGGRFMLRNAEGCFGFADRDLNIAIPLKYNRIPWGADYPFRDNSETACLAIGEKLILVDKDGAELLYFN